RFVPRRCRAASPALRVVVPALVQPDPVADRDGIDMDHDHEHDHEDGGSELSEMDLRVRALESLLVEKGYVDPKALDLLIETYEINVGPHNGARVVARAWA